MTTPTRSLNVPAAPPWCGALAGLGSGAVGVAVGTAVAALLDGVPSPVISVGNRAVDLAPPFLKDFAVRQFGTADKAVLIAGTLAVLAAVVTAAGLLGRRRPGMAYGIVVLLGLVGVVATAFDRTSTASRALTILPALVTVLVTLGALHFLLGTLQMRPQSTDELPSGFDRRLFLKAVVGVGAVAVAAAAVGRFVGGTAASVSRAAIRIVRPSSPAAAVPPGADLGVAGVTPYITPNSDFYRVDTALVVPDVPAEGWSLRVHGLVDRELRFGFRDLMAMPLVERRITLTCVSNEVGGPYVGNATWIGVPMRDLLERAGVRSGADAVKSTSADGWTCGTPLSALTDSRNALVAIAMNGEPLPLQHGFPARMVVPGLYGYVSATKWLVDLEVTRFADFTAYWTSRGYAATAPIKMSSRIDVPRSFQTMSGGEVTFGGVAWAQAVGIAQVQVRVDDGEWHQADLGTRDGIESWRQWSWTWREATPGRHEVSVRAVDETGTTQISERAPIRPDGATGWHTVQFSVA